MLISGHPEYCPDLFWSRSPVPPGGSMLKRGFVGRGMRLEFSHPAYRTPITTSRVKEIRECSKHCDEVRSPDCCVRLALRGNRTLTMERITQDRSGRRRPQWISRGKGPQSEADSAKARGPERQGSASCEFLAVQERCNAHPIFKAPRNPSGNPGF